ncbi:MAG: hypothetical protein ACK56I_20220, partial [bacterium]
MGAIARHLPVGGDRGQRAAADLPVDAQAHAAEVTRSQRRDIHVDLVRARHEAVTGNGPRRGRGGVVVDDIPGKRELEVVGDLEKQLRARTHRVLVVNRAPGRQIVDIAVALAAERRGAEE